MPVELEWIILLFHLAMVVITDFTDIPGVNDFYEIGLVMVALPMVAIVGGAFLAVFRRVSGCACADCGKNRARCRLSLRIDRCCHWLVRLPDYPRGLVHGGRVLVREKGRGGTERARIHPGRPPVRGVDVLPSELGLSQLCTALVLRVGDSSNGLVYTVCVLALTGLALFAGRRDQTTSPEPAGSGCP